MLNFGLRFVVCCKTRVVLKKFYIPTDLCYFTLFGVVAFTMLFFSLFEQEGASSSKGSPSGLTGMIFNISHLTYCHADVCGSWHFPLFFQL